MIDYLSEVKPLQDAGVSNADIATHLNARTLGSMQSQASIYVLQDTGAVLIDPVTGNKFGSFITYYESLPDGDAKLTEEDVRNIRSSNKRNAELGREFGVHRATISSIRRRRTWKHVQ